MRKHGSENKLSIDILSRHDRKITTPHTVTYWYSFKQTGEGISTYESNKSQTPIMLILSVPVSIQSEKHPCTKVHTYLNDPVFHVRTNDSLRFWKVHQNGKVWTKSKRDYEL